MQIQIPNWVPDPVRHLIRELENDLPQQDEPEHALVLLNRLATNDSMQHVWRLLSRNDFRNEEMNSMRASRLFADEAAAGSLSLAEQRLSQRADHLASELWRNEIASIVGLPIENHKVTARVLFRQAFMLALVCDQPLTVRDKIRWRHALKKCISDLERISVRLKQNKLPGASKACLSLCEDIAREMALHPALRRDVHAGVLIRATENDPQRAYAVALSKVTLGLFGKRLYGTIAHIENAIFEPEHEITLEAVREWCRPDR